MNRAYIPLRAFDPLAGTVVMEPERNERGYWVGCPSVLRENTGEFWLTYRQRRPRGAKAERGWRCAVAVSDDGLNFSDVWSVHKDELPTPSMERFCLIRASGSGYRLYLSYVDPADGRWRIDSVAAGHPASFDISSREPVLTAGSTGTEGVKDPLVLQVGPVTYMFVSFAAPIDGLDPKAHSTGDIYNVGATTHPSGLAISTDGENFSWRGEILSVGSGWNRYQARLSSVAAVPGGYVGFYDGSASCDDNYEEHCGIAVSPDLLTWHCLTDGGPWVQSPNATGSLRYFDAFILDGEWWIYYELTRPDYAHELRLIRLPAV
ncbi:MAG TPA: hypothetical protein VE733_16110 [Streptosporangiaceae bacterium]|jgi:hypothetical protein|nr:hypothetical protein [Streptosporangiaceae bacterium]